MTFEPPRSGAGDSATLYDVRPYRVRSTHWPLLQGQGTTVARPRARAGFDAFVMLNHLHPERLGFGARLAATLGCRLLVLCTASHQAAAVAALNRRLHRPRRIDVLSLPWPAPFPLDGLTSAEGGAARSPRHRDVAAKRNLALAVARSSGWRRVLFLDDDVRSVTPASARSAAAMLDAPQVRAVCWTCPSYPDNSVVCHARRLTNLPQSTFVGAGAMALDVTTDLPMFPPVYNEDWLFLYDLVAAGRVRCVGDAGQLRFNPFASPERAREEEFGDLLAEGLFHLLHEGVHDPLTVGESYWRHAAEVRAHLVGELRSRLGGTDRSRPGHSWSDHSWSDRSWARAAPRHRPVDQALRSLEAAAAEHAELDAPALLASFVRSWRSDLVVWHEWFRSLPVVDGMADVIARLHMPECGLVTL